MKLIFVILLLLAGCTKKLDEVQMKQPMSCDLAFKTLMMITVGDVIVPSPEGYTEAVCKFGPDVQAKFSEIKRRHQKCINFIYSDGKKHSIADNPCSKPFLDVPEASTPECSTDKLAPFSLEKVRREEWLFLKLIPAMFDKSDLDRKGQDDFIYDMHGLLKNKITLQDSPEELCKKLIPLLNFN